MNFGGAAGRWLFRDSEDGVTTERTGAVAPACYARGDFSRTEARTPEWHSALARGVQRLERERGSLGACVPMRSS